MFIFWHRKWLMICSVSLRVLMYAFEFSFTWLMLHDSLTTFSFNLCILHLFCYKSFLHICEQIRIERYRIYGFVLAKRGFLIWDLGIKMRSFVATLWWILSLSFRKTRCVTHDLKEGSNNHLSSYSNILVIIIFCFNMY